MVKKDPILIDRGSHWWNWTFIQTDNKFWFPESELLLNVLQILGNQSINIYRCHSNRKLIENTFTKAFISEKYRKIVDFSKKKYFSLFLFPFGVNFASIFISIQNYIEVPNFRFLAPPSQIYKFHPKFDFTPLFSPFADFFFRFEISRKSYIDPVYLRSIRPL